MRPRDLILNLIKDRLELPTTIVDYISGDIKQFTIAFVDDNVSVMYNCWLSEDSMGVNIKGPSFTQSLNLKVENNDSRYFGLSQACERHVKTNSKLISSEISSEKYSEHLKYLEDLENKRIVNDITDPDIAEIILAAHKYLKESGIVLMTIENLKAALKGYKKKEIEKDQSEFEQFYNKGKKLGIDALEEMNKKLRENSVNRNPGDYRIPS